MRKDKQTTGRLSARRAFLAGLGATAAGVGAMATGAHAQTPSGRFQPARHTLDNWMETLPGKHRVVIDAVSPDGAGSAILFANNLFTANQSGYGLGDKDIAIIVVMRHFATPFAFTDAIWAKYGKAMGGMLKLTDPKSKEAPATNMYNADYGMELPNFGNTIDAQIKRGVHFAICDMATHFIASHLAGEGGNADAIYKEFAAATVANSHFVSAGVVGVTRAQERGYELIYAG